MDSSEGFPPGLACAKNLLRSVPHFRCNRTGNNERHHPIGVKMGRGTPSRRINYLDQSDLASRLSRKYLLNDLSP